MQYAKLKKVEKEKPISIVRMEDEARLVIEEAEAAVEARLAAKAAARAENERQQRAVMARAVARARAMAEEDARIEAVGVDQWFYIQTDKKLGPLTLAEMLLTISDVSLDPPVKLVWTEGMDGWRPVYEVRRLCEPLPQVPNSINESVVISNEPVDEVQAISLENLEVVTETVAADGVEEDLSVKTANDAQVAAAQLAASDAKEKLERAKVDTAKAEAKAAAAEAKAAQEASLRSLAEAEAAIASKAREQAEVEARAKAENEAQLQASATRASAMAAEEAKIRAAEEIKAAAAEARAADEARRRAMAEAKAEEESKRRMASEARAAVAKLRSDEEARLKSAREEERRAIAEAKAEKEAKLRIAAEARLKVEEKARRSAEAKAAHEARLAAGKERRMEKSTRALIAQVKVEAAQAKLTQVKSPAKASSRNSWHYTCEGDRLGPVSFEELRAMATDLSLDPRLDMVWRQGMDAWKPAGQVDGLFARTSVPVAQETPCVVISHPRQKASMTIARFVTWPGARRRSLLIIALVFPIAWHHTLALASPFLVRQFGDRLMAEILPFAAFLPLFVLIHFSIKRLSNLGMSRLWCFAAFAPVLNLWIGYRCIVCPAGYAYQRKLDKPGIALAIVYWLVVLGILTVIAATLALLFGAVESPVLQGQLRHFIRTAVMPLSS